MLKKRTSKSVKQGGLQMHKTLVVVVLGLTLLLGAPTVYKTLVSKTPVTQEISTGDAFRAPIKMSNSLELDSGTPPKIFDVKKIVKLEAKNTVVLRGPVTVDSVSQVMVKLKRASRKLRKNATIYLVIDSPGGSVFAGLSLIDFMKALPQKITTITLFAASMGFQIVQNSDHRMITTNGTLMSHRARGGVNGQFDGELESRYKMVKRAIDYMDTVASKRMGLSLKSYKSLILNEYWVHGFDAVSGKAADEQILVRCGASLDGVDPVKLKTLFGTINAKFSKCPLIKVPVSVVFESKNKKNLNYLKYLHRVSFKDYNKFMADFLFKPKFNQTFPSN